MVNDDLSMGEETLRDGRVVGIRALRDDDARGLGAFWRRLGARDRHLFLTLAHLATEDPGAVALARPGVAGVVAVTPDSSGRLAGVARYQLREDDAAEFMVFVDASYRRAGLGTVLIGRLAESVRHAGVHRLVGDVPASDAPMRALLHQLGLDYDERVAGDQVRASFAVQETDAYLDALLADQRAAARAALDSFLAPESIAVVGASDDRTSIGGLLFANLRASDYRGDLFAVNPHHDVVQGVPSVADLSACARRPDLAVVAVPASLVGGIVDQAGELGVRALCVISAGFAEVGPAGRALQDDLRQRARGRRASHRPQLHGRAQRRTRDALQRDVQPRLSPAGTRGVRLAVGRLGAGRPRPARQPRPRRERLRVGGQHRRSDRERPPALLGRRPSH
jgi:GNAT superfamily N-acetyltransferase/predicted CoA-binding protein